MIDLLSAYQRDLNASLKKLTTDLAQALVAAAKAVEEFNAATAARGVTFEAEMAERMRHFREGPRDGVVAVESMAGRIAPAGPAMPNVYETAEAPQADTAPVRTGGRRLPGWNPSPLTDFEKSLVNGTAMPNVYESTGAP